MTTADEQPVVRGCRACGRSFTIQPDEIRALEAIAERCGWPVLRLPARCTGCRIEDRKAADVVAADDPDHWLTCIDCGEGFVFGGRDRDYYARQVPPFVRPRRCRDCRRRR